ncbi:protein TRI1 [Ziziphus jujuba]|uniref:Protein TRI1 n=2 Tax=Ziziphus jujuba TaxID=326968 RepID=A0A6P4A5D9_ZIZJJ|nr:protein TRI1 [Ziziphus jujuba]KAH7519146.1 hypothetical protein FEM48_Zijuj08G0004800 [Ziziphus jujuba var. spinosa]
MASSALGRGSRVLMAAGKAASASAAAKAPPRSNMGIMKVVPVSPVLGNFLGTSEASRSLAVKKVWEYVKLHNLQNPANKKEIFCDETLKTIFSGKDTVGFPEIARLLSQHFIKSSA